MPDRDARSSAEYIARITGEQVAPDKPVKAEDYADYKESAFAEETEQEREEREKLMAKGVIGLKSEDPDWLPGGFHPNYRIVDGDRMRGSLADLLTPEEFARNTADW